MPFDKRKTERMIDRWRGVSAELAEAGHNDTLGTDEGEKFWAAAEAVDKCIGFLETRLTDPVYLSR